MFQFISRFIIRTFISQKNSQEKEKDTKTTSPPHPFGDCVLFIEVNSDDNRVSSGSQPADVLCHQF
jgi:hypothetical protein